jgi:uncharacterized protein YabN with tetrapyrrole methylase and pyrophosphatase domain
MAKISVIGLGIKGADELTLRALRELKKTDKIFILSSDCDSSIQNTLLENGIKNAFFINFLYKNMEIDIFNYKAIFDFLSEQAFQNDSVAFLCTGHPRIGVSLVQMLEKEADKLKITLNIIEGISSFDTMINDLKIDPLERGSIIIDANRLLIYDIDIPNTLNIFIYHISSIGTQKINYSNHQSTNKSNFLKKKLLHHYNEDKRMVLVTSSTNKFENNFVFQDFELKNLEETFSNSYFWSTLYIPSDNPKKINKEFLNELMQQNEFY